METQTVNTEEEREKARADRLSLAGRLLPPFTKEDLPLLRAAHAQGRWFMDLYLEGWTDGN